MLNLPHPDTLTTQQAVKQITRGGRQAADDQAMEAMWQALERREGKEEAKKVFTDTYKQVIDGTSANTMEGNKGRDARKTRIAGL